MSILIDEKTAIIVQGITGDKGSFHTREMIGHGSNVVGGVTPGKGRTTHLGVPVFNTVKEALRATGATASITFVAPGFAADAIHDPHRLILGDRVKVVHRVAAFGGMQQPGGLPDELTRERFVLLTLFAPDPADNSAGLLAAAVVVDKRVIGDLLRHRVPFVGRM